jgi:GxxExxY protein
MPRPIKSPIVCEELTYQIIGAAYAVHQGLKSGHKEIVYQNALCEDLALLRIPFQREPALNVAYKGKKVGGYQPDLLVENKVIVEIKAVGYLPRQAETQLAYYLRATGYRVGLLLNFGSKSLQIKRRIYG